MLDNIKKFIKYKKEVKDIRKKLTTSDFIKYDDYNLKNIDVLKAIIKEIAFIDKLDSSGRSLLHYCAWDDYIESIKYLLKKGANINIQCNEGGTPLLYATSEDNYEACKLLISKGANLNIQSYNRNLKDGVGKISPLRKAVEKKYFGICKLLLSSGADVNIEDQQGLTPLDMAYYVESPQICKLLLAYGAKPANYKMSKIGNFIGEKL